MATRTFGLWAAAVLVTGTLAGCGGEDDRPAEQSSRGDDGALGGSSVGGGPAGTGGSVSADADAPGAIDEPGDAGGTGASGTVGAGGGGGDPGSGGSGTGGASGGVTTAGAGGGAILAAGAGQFSTGDLPTGGNAGASGGSEPGAAGVAGAGAPPSGVVTSSFDGTWQGETDAGAPVAFLVCDGEVLGFAMPLVFRYAGSSCGGTAVQTTDGTIVDDHTEFFLFLDVASNGLDVSMDFTGDVTAVGSMPEVRNGGLICLDPPIFAMGTESRVAGPYTFTAVKVSSDGCGGEIGAGGAGGEVGVGGSGGAIGAGGSGGAIATGGVGGAAGGAAGGASAGAAGAGGAAGAAGAAAGAPAGGGSFTCADGATIPAAWVCDGIIDCEDESDEAGC